MKELLTFTNEGGHRLIIGLADNNDKIALKIKTAGGEEASYYLQNPQAKMLSILLENREGLVAANR